MMRLFWNRNQNYLADIVKKQYFFLHWAVRENARGSFTKVSKRMEALANSSLGLELFYSYALILNTGMHFFFSFLHNFGFCM